ncbi:sushi, von Willebrand factor type A, EGF and pentraxin domain-containing protein 1-like [Mya arenaria]|uniref:sushi, von Willebrand factor type A, EGF and pentraxin domain-containing protein 1-like n=1 Tax=Mya arenaria TaxID=6604 RepID=UPI0022E45666|nr:sushi, von Willebrand factor type A, EGF and pentraxin domain-containing protein 1-like [Mya arenaria]
MSKRRDASPNPRDGLMERCFAQAEGYVNEEMPRPNRGVGQQRDASPNRGMGQRRDASPKPMNGSTKRCLAQPDEWVNEDMPRPTRGMGQRRDVSIENGDLAPPYGYNTSLANSSVLYVCNEGYTMFGDAKVICALVPDSYPPVYEWTKTPECRNIVHCGDAPEVANGRHKAEYSREVGSTVAYVCYAGHVLEGKETITCVADEDGTSASWTTPPQCVVDCFQPPSIQNGTMVAMSGTREGETASYECDTGFKLFGSENITCLNTSKWSDAPHCTIDCGEPKEIKYGSVVKFTGTTVGNIATYECSNRTVMVGQNYSTCQVSAEWSVTPTCIPVCGSVPEIENGNHRKVYTKGVNSTVPYTCNAGYTLNGSEVITCAFSNGDEFPDWSTPPTCKKTCEDIPTISNGSYVKKGNTSPGSIVTYICDEGFEFENWTTIECDGDGKWSEIPVCKKIVQCQNIPTIDNGLAVVPTTTTVATTESPTVTTTEEPTTTTEGFTTTTDVNTFTTTTDIPEVLNGTDGENITDTTDNTGKNNTTDESAEEDNMAQGANETAIDGNQQTDNSTDGGISTDNNSSANSTSLSTTDGNSSLDNVTDNANETETTTPEVLTTAAVTTTAASTDGNNSMDNVTDNANVTEATTPAVTTMKPTTVAAVTAPPLPETSLPGTVITFQCNAGYILKDNDSIVCESDGQWSRPLPECIRVCPPPVPVANAMVDSKGLVAGSNATYTCLPGFAMVGGEQITCQFDGIWTQEPRCDPICQNPPSIANGTITSLTGLFVGDTATYVCNNNFSMIGLENSTCLPSLEWSSSPFCEKDCGDFPVIPNSNRELVHLCNDSSCVCTPDYCDCNGTKLYNQSERLCNTTDEAAVRYVCKERFEMHGNPIVSCDNAGSFFEWSALPYCTCIRKSIDLLFVIDSSGSVGIEGFNNTKEFLINLIREFPADRTRVGLMFFADTANIVFNLNEYVTNSQGMIDAIKNVTYEGGATKTYDGLQLARETMFTAANGMRDNASRILILLSDGQSDDVNRTIAQAEMLKNTSVTIYTVGVGDYANELELGPVASPRAGSFNETYYFPVDNYANIDQVSGPLADATCSAGAEDNAEDYDYDYDYE